MKMLVKVMVALLCGVLVAALGVVAVLLYFNHFQF